VTVASPMPDAEPVTQIVPIVVLVVLERPAGQSPKAPAARSASMRPASYPSTSRIT
jgi:hypothetical protein